VISKKIQNKNPNLGSELIIALEENQSLEKRKLRFKLPMDNPIQM
jgi:hypothetical protein